MRIRTFAALALLGGAALHAQSQAPEAPPPWRQPLEQTIEKLIAVQHVTGLAVGVVSDGKLAYAHGFGVQSLQTHEPVTERSLFQMASVTKTFVATSILQLVEEDQIDLDAPLIKYLPYFRLADDRAKAITIRQLLSHTAGMPDVTDFEWDKPQYDDEALERYVRSLSDRTLIAAPGTRFQYSNIGFEVLADVIAKVSGESFEDYVQTHILTPLGMKHSTLLVREADGKLLCAPHVSDAFGAFAVSKVFPYNRPHAGSSTLYSNVVDMSRFALANLARGVLEGEQILNSASYDLLWTRSPVAGAPVGLCWFLGMSHGLRTMSHSGGDVGFSTNLVLVPERGVAVIVLSNCTADAVRTVTEAALDLLLR